MSPRQLWLLPTQRTSQLLSNIRRACERRKSLPRDLIASPNGSSRSRRKIIFQSYRIFLSLERSTKRSISARRSRRIFTSLWRKSLPIFTSCAENYPPRGPHSFIGIQKWQSILHHSRQKIRSHPFLKNCCAQKTSSWH